MPPPFAGHGMERAMAALHAGFPALRPTTYAGRPTAVRAPERGSAPVAAGSGGDGGQVGARRAGSGRADTNRSARPVATAGDRVALTFGALAFVSFLVLVLALVVPASVGLPLAGAAFVGLVASRIFTLVAGWPLRAPALPARSPDPGG